MADYIVNSGESSYGITVDNGQTMEVMSGGTASDVKIDPGGLETVDDGGSDFTAAVYGEQDVYGGATAAIVIPFIRNTNRRRHEFTPSRTTLRAARSLPRGPTCSARCPTRTRTTASWCRPSLSGPLLVAAGRVIEIAAWDDVPSM